MDRVIDGDFRGGGQETTYLVAASEREEYGGSGEQAERARGNDVEGSHRVDSRGAAGPGASHRTADMKGPEGTCTMRGR